MNDLKFFALFAAALIIAGLLMIVITLTKKGARPLDVEKYRSKWLDIESSLKQDQEATFQMAILQADKLLDHALREKGYIGQTMAERMKKSQFKNADATWAAHKLRNRIAHEHDVSISYDTARRALATFKQALKDVGAI